MALFVNSNPLQNDEEITYGNNDTGVLNEFAKGFGSGVDQLQALGGGAKALAGSALGIDSWFEDGMEYFDEQMAEAAENTADVGSIEEIGNLASFEGLGNLANYSAFIVGNIIPSLIGGGGVGAVGGAAAKQLAIHQGAKALIKKNAEGMAKGAASRQYAQSAVGREALGKAGLKGQRIGAVGFGTTMGAGESFTKIFDETGEEAAVYALGTGLLSGALDAMTPMRVLKRVLPQNLYGKATQEIAENIVKKQSVIGRALKQAAEVSGIEGVTEMSQEVLQNTTLEFVRGQGDPRIEEAFLERLFDEENRSQYLNAFVAGAIGGGAIGGVTGAVTKDPELKQNLDDDALKGEPTEGSPEVVQDEEQDQDQNETVEDQPQPEATDDGGERVQAARAKALGLPTGRTTIAPKSRDQVREEVDGLPEQREATDPEAMQVEARAKVRAQIDGLPAVREKIKEIYQMELGTLGETTRIPKDKEPEPVAEEPPVFGGNLPESITPRMEELVGKDVDYNGNKGPVLKKDDGFYVATQDNGDVLVESGEYQSPEQLGVVPTGGDLVFEKDVQIDGNNKFELRGKKYTLTRIIRDADGNPLSLAVRDDKGAKRNIRTPEVVSRISNQKNPAPDFRQIIVELDDLPASIQKQVVQQSDPENIPDSVPASQAIEIAQSLPNSESMISDIQEMATQSLTISASAEAISPPVKYTESVNRPSIKPLAQAIADVNKAQGSNRSPIDEGRINSLFDAGTLTLDDGTRLPSVMQNDGKDGSAKSDEIKSALVDLLGAGMPKRVLKHFKGLYVHPPSQGKREADGAYLPRQQAISLNKARISELAADTDDSTSAAALMRFNLAHEIGHAFDLGEGHTLNSPDFSIDVDGMTPSGVTFDLGPVLYELGQNFQDGTELGLELGYPFGYAYEWLSTATPAKIEKKVSLIQKEAFAQAFAVFHASPEMLQEQAPLTYKHLENLLRTQPTETIQDGEADIRSGETGQQSQEVQGQVRSPAESGSPEVQIQDGAGGASGSGIDAEQAGQGLGEQTQRADGDSAGRPVQLEQTDPKVKRAADFENTGNYNVTYPDGTEYLIYRDTMQFANPMWHLSPEYYDILKLDFNAIQRTGGIGDNRKEALQWLNKAHNDRVGNAAPDQAGDLTSFDDDALLIQKRDLSPAAQKITASDALYGGEQIQVTGTSRNGAVVVVDLARAFDARVKDATGGTSLGEKSVANTEIVSDLIAHEAVQAMATDGNAGEWYQQKVANAMSLASKEFPELSNDANAKFAFTSIMAITSNGASVPENSVNTFQIYQDYRDSKVFPDFGVGKESQAMKSSFALLNRLIEIEGINSVREFMDKDVTVKTLKDDFGLSVSGELMGTKLKGSAILGPKIGGGFYQNLNGNFEPLTMDRWFMRTWGRLTGTLMADAERKLPVQMAKFREVALGEDYKSKLKADGINRAQLAKDDQYALAYGMKVQSAYANGGFKEKNTLNKAANTFKNSQGEKQAPQNGNEREYIRSVMRMALDKVNETSGQAPVNMGALQAIIWYPEKDLYKQLGVGNAKSEPTDYETEFKKIVESRSQRGSGVSGSDGSAQQSGAGRLERADGQNDQDAGQSTSRPNQQSNAEADQLNAPPRRNPQRMAQAKAQGFDTDRVLYHGTPQGSDFSAFDYKYTGQGNDQYGAGFYLTDSSGQANGYAGAGIQGESNTVIPVYTKNTNLLKVDGKKVSNLGEAIELDADQIRQILEKAEPLNRGVNDEDMNPFGDRYESFWDNGPEQWMFDQLAQDQEGRNPDELVDFFDGDMQGYLTALSDVTGYDGLELQFGDGLVNQVHWKPENIRSVNAQFDPAKAQSDDLLASPPRRPSDTDFVTAPTSTAAEIMSDDDLIASVRTGTTSGGESGIPSSGIKKWLQKNFSSRGLLPETAFDSMIQRDGEFGAVELDIRQMVGIYDNAVVENFGNIDGQQRAVLDDAMKRPAAEIEKTSLPRNIKDSLIAMRGYIDSLSTQYAQVLNNDIETLKAQGNDEATAKSELLSIVVNNMGTYANRSYQAFNNKDWNKEVPEEVVLAARNLLVEQGTVNPDQVINTILKEGTAYDDMASFISESKLGAKDLAILTKRKQIAPEIRALLGEYKDPRVNFANSASKMSRLIYNDRFLKEVLASGNGVFLFDQESAPADATKKIAEVGSKTLSPLNGMYTYPEVEQAFKDALGKEEMGDLYRTIIKVNGLVKYGKTVIAPTTMARNFMSASLFTVANGHFNWSKLSKSAEVSGSYFSGIGDGIEYLKNLKKLGVVHDSPYAGEMIAYLQDANAEGILDQRDPSAILDTKDAALSLGKRVAQGFTKAYQFGDDFWKIVGFENEVMSFMENKGMSREEAEPLAAKRIRDTYPTYSLIGKIPQQLRRFPLVGTFVSFPAEIVRTQANMIKYLREDLADPDMRPAALKRITGMAMMSAGVYAAQAMAMSAFGVSEEEEEAIKLMAAPWAKNSNILVTGRDDEGRLEYLDLTHLDPYALMKRPLNALMRDQPIDDALIDASAEILKPFLGWDISTNTILEFISNEKSSGGEVYNDADTFINKSIATYMHFERGMGPSFLQNARRIEKAMGGEVSKSGKAYDMGDEMGALVGFRKTTFDPKTALHFKAYEFSEGKRQSTKLLTSVFRDPNDVSDSDIREAFGRASTARKETFNDMAALVNAAMASGLNATQAMTVLRSNGVTKKDARALIDGGASAWTMSDSTLKNSIVKSDILFGQQKSQEFKDRWTLIQQLLKEES